MDRQCSRRATQGQAFRQGFTLVELLVVLAVISVLLGILIPVLSAARARSLQAACLANVRQVTVATLARGLETSGWLPLAGPVEVAMAGPGGLPSALLDAQRTRYVYVPEAWPWFTPTHEQVAPTPAALVKQLGIRGVEISQGALTSWSSIDRQALSVFRCPAQDDGARDSQPTTTLSINGVRHVALYPIDIDYAFNGGVLGFNQQSTHDQRRMRGNLSRI